MFSPKHPLNLAIIKYSHGLLQPFESKEVIGSGFLPHILCTLGPYNTNLHETIKWPMFEMHYLRKKLTYETEILYTTQAIGALQDIGLSVKTHINF